MSRLYQDHEFCKAISCPHLKQNTINPDHFYCPYREEGCAQTAKAFHSWLDNNDFIILKIDNPLIK